MALSSPHRTGPVARTAGPSSTYPGRLPSDTAAAKSRRPERVVRCRRPLSRPRHTSCRARSSSRWERPTASITSSTRLLRGHAATTACSTACVDRTSPVGRSRFARRDSTPCSVSSITALSTTRRRPPARKAYAYRSNAPPKSSALRRPHDRVMPLPPLDPAHPVAVMVPRHDPPAPEPAEFRASSEVAARAAGGRIGSEREVHVSGRNDLSGFQLCRPRPWQ